LLHYTLPGSKNLFKVGVSESAGPWNLISAATAASYNDPLAARFGCYSNTTGVNITCLRDVPYAQIYNYTWAASQPTYDNLIKNPVDVTFGSKQLLKKAKANNPLMVGYANYEGNQFAWLALRIFTKNPHPALNASFPLFFGILNATLPYTQDIIQNVANYYANLSVNGNYYIPLREALGDYGIKCGIARTAYNALNGLGRNNVYNFFFQHDTADWRYTFLNATHTVEVPYLFLTNGTIAETKFTPEEIRLARRLVKYIGNFQDTRNPNEEPRNRDPALPNVNNLPNWPKFKKDKASTLAWDLTSDVITLPVPAPCKIYWDNLIINNPFPRRSSGKNTVDFDKFFTDPKAMELKSMFH
jgi:carboxylesterase type B